VVFAPLQTIQASLSVALRGNLTMLQHAALPTQRQTPGFLSARFRAYATAEIQPVRVSGLTSSDAEDLLDWLESQNLCGRVSLPEAASGFTIEYQGNP
jgi:hypothetical protein